VTDLKILVSPDTAIAASVEDALKQWKFAPGQFGPDKAPLHGKITFSFEIDKAGKSEVRNPVPLK